MDSLRTPSHHTNMPPYDHAPGPEDPHVHSLPNQRKHSALYAPPRRCLPCLATALASLASTRLLPSPKALAHLWA